MVVCQKRKGASWIFRARDFDHVCRTTTVRFFFFLEVLVVAGVDCVYLEVIALPHAFVESWPM